MIVFTHIIATPRHNSCHLPEAWNTTQVRIQAAWVNCVDYEVYNTTKMVKNLSMFDADQKKITYSGGSLPKI